MDASFESFGLWGLLASGSFLSATLLLSWPSVVGDALCAASGWLRQDVAAAAACIAAGKFARYWVLAKGVVILAS